MIRGARGAGREPEGRGRGDEGWETALRLGGCLAAQRGPFRQQLHHESHDALLALQRKQQSGSQWLHDSCAPESHDPKGTPG